MGNFLRDENIFLGDCQLIYESLVDNNYFIQTSRSLNDKEHGTKEEEWNPFAAMFICKKNEKSTMSTNRTFFPSALGYKIFFFFNYY